MENSNNDTNNWINSLNKNDTTTTYILKLYVTGMSSRSKQAIERVRETCETHLKNRYELEVIDLYQNPGKARKEQIIAAPTLIKELPLPVRKIIGSMKDKEKLLIGLDIKTEA